MIMSPWSQLSEARQIRRRGILKAPRHFVEQKVEPISNVKSPRFDEASIATSATLLHVSDEDYGGTKTAYEPKTPTKYASDVEDGELTSPDEKTERSTDKFQLDVSFSVATNSSENYNAFGCRRSPSADKEDLELLTPKEREKRKQFELKRKAHSNEYHAVKMARQLIDSDDENEHETQDNKTVIATHSMATDVETKNEM